MAGLVVVMYGRGTMVTIDPGIGGTGLACFGNGGLVDVAVVKPKRKKDAPASWERRAAVVTRGVVDWLRDCGDITFVIIENPELQEGSTKGLAAKNSGALLKLTLLTGSIIGAINALGLSRTVTLVTPAAWKGQLKKEVCFQRIIARLGAHPAVAALEADRGRHAADAVGIGLWALGEF